MVDPSSAARDILNSRNISRVVVVDDDVGQPPWYGRVDMLGEEDRADIGDATGFDLLGSDWRDRLELVDRETRRGVAKEVNSVADDQRIPQPRAVENHALRDLRHLLRSHCTRMLTPNQWQHQAEELIAQAKSEPTLFLIDERLESGRTGGLLIQHALPTASQGCFFCILTAEVEIPNEFDDWQSMCRKYGFSPGQVGIVSKAHLTGDQLGFAQMLKISFTARQVSDVRERLLAAVRDGVTEALHRFEQLDMPVLTSIVFGSSNVEGAWELETMFRVVKAFIRDSLDNRVYGDQRVAAAVREIAEPASVWTGSDERLKEFAFEIQNAERYVTGDYLSERRMALANGDLFEVTNTEDATNLWVLVAQPCDLAIRSDGTRSASPTHLVMLPIEACAQEPRWANVELQHYEQSSDRRFVRLTRPAYVPTIILDLAAFSACGKAVWVREREAFAVQAVGWERRANKVFEQFDSAFQDHGHVDNARLGRITEGRLPAAQNPDVHPTVVGTTIEYPIRRIGRLRERQAEAVLQAFGLALSRTAEAHDLARINPEASSSS